LASFDRLVSYEDSDSGEDVKGAEETVMRSGMTESSIYCFDKENLYLRDKEFMKLKKDGKIKIIEDRTKRKLVYSTSANVSHYHLFENGQSAPLDFKD